MGKKENGLTCKLTTPEFQKRKETVLLELRNLVKEKKELNNGYAYRFNGSNDMLDMISGFIKSERLCCDFFSFDLHIKDQDTLWLDITGPEGAKDFIKTELEL